MQSTFDKQLATGVSPTPPQKQIDYATRFAEAAGESLSDEAKASQQECCKYIDEKFAAGALPPSQKETNYPTHLAEAAGESLLDEAKTSKKECSKYIDEKLREIARGKKVYMEKQIGYAKELAGNVSLGMAITGQMIQKQCPNV